MRVNGEVINDTVELGLPIAVIPIPEPATALLVALGLAGLAAYAVRA